MNQHYKSYLIGSAILTILWWIVQYFGWSDTSVQVDSIGDFSGTSATTQSLEGFIKEIKDLPK